MTIVPLALEDALSDDVAHLFQGSSGKEQYSKEKGCGWVAPHAIHEPPELIKSPEKRPRCEKRGVCVGDSPTTTLTFGRGCLHDSSLPKRHRDEDYAVPRSRRAKCLRSAKPNGWAWGRGG